MTYTTTEITRLLNIDAPKIERQVSQLLIDSRSLIYPEETMFFAITTATGDGHRYISELYEKGVRTFVVTHIPDEMKYKAPDAAFLVVDDVTRALQTLAEYHRHRFTCPIIGITGSRG